jgi:hypothetical protein
LLAQFGDDDAAGALVQLLARATIPRLEVYDRSGKH